MYRRFLEPKDDVWFIILDRVYIDREAYKYKIFTPQYVISFIYLIYNTIIIQDMFISFYFLRFIYK